MNFKCNKTNKTFTSYRGLLNHLRYEYETMADAFLCENDKVLELCEFCNIKHKKFKSFKDGFHVHCGDKKCIKKSLKISNQLIADNKIKKRINLPINIVKWLIKCDRQMLLQKNTIFNGIAIGNISISQYLSNNFNKPTKKCKFCDSEFIVSFKNIKKKHCCSQSCIQLFKHGYMKIKNNFTNKELNNKWFYLNTLYGEKKANNMIKAYMSCPEDFKKIYNHGGTDKIIIDGWYFMASRKHDELYKFIKINFDISQYQHLIISCLNCNNIADINKSLIKKRVKQFCSHECYIDYKIKNPSKFEYLESTKLKQSIKLKKNILEGKFTPPTTNSWCKSRIIYKNNAFRSSWEALFYILYNNGDLLFEKLRIPYTINDNTRIYIVDFINHNTKTVYEIKPNSEKNSIQNILKEKALQEWCIINDYTYHLITEDYFKKQNITEEHIKILVDLQIYKKLKGIIN